MEMAHQPRLCRPAGAPETKLSGDETISRFDADRLKPAMVITASNTTADTATNKRNQQGRPS